MLQAVLEYINNWFEAEAYGGTWTVSNGVVDRNPGIQDGQWFRVVGSVFNDGLHKWPARLADETFRGELRALNVPREVQDLALEIGEWCEAHAKELDSPYTSESFGGYSYTKGSPSRAAAAATTGDYSWQDHFKARLRAWRKL